MGHVQFSSHVIIKLVERGTVVNSIGRSVKDLQICSEG